MCGFTFIYDPSCEAAGLRQRTGRATERLRHRGPDGGGLAHGDGWCMGHRRLSIIDIAGSSQPMWSPDRRFALAFNGEIYNFRELRSALAKDWNFVSQGDTEVLLAGLVLHGADFLPRMEGMWAFALWDEVSRALLLSRDRMGKKPLYYSQAADVVACASELNALHTLLPEGNWSEDQDSTADYLRYGFQLPGFTAYAGVREVRPGHAVRWVPGKHAAERRYWRLPTTRFEGTYEAAARQVREQLIRAVELRLTADVEVGAFLSGGVDSSLIAAIIRNELGRSLRSFTISFEDRSFDESAYAAEVATALGTHHTVQRFHHGESDELSDLVLRRLGQPFADRSVLPTAQVSQLASQHVKVALSGDGGDELFMGYERYHARTLLRWYTRLPRVLRKGLAWAVRHLPEPSAHHSRSLLKKAHLFQDVVDRLEGETPYVSNLFFSPSEQRRLFPELAPMGHEPPDLPEETAENDLLPLMFADALTYLPQDILTKVDRASMGHSLEVRAPFLDSRLIATAFGVAEHWHRQGMKGKRLLQAACGDLIAPTVWNRRKQGFGVPTGQWFNGHLGGELTDLAHATDHPLAVVEVETLLNRHRYGGRDFGFRLWNLYVYLLWIADGKLPRS